MHGLSSKFLVRIAYGARYHRTLASLPYVERVNSCAGLTIWGSKEARIFQIDQHINSFGAKKDLHDVILEKECIKQAAIATAPDIFALDQSADLFSRDLILPADIETFLRNHYEKTKTDPKPYRDALNHWIQASLNFHEELIKEIKGGDDLWTSFEEEVIEKVEKYNVNLVWIAGELTKHNLQLTFSDLFAALIALNLWPQKFTYNTRAKYNVLAKRPSDFIALFNALDSLSFGRNGILAGADEDCQTSTIWHKLILAKAWTQVIVNGYYGRVREWTFPFYFLDKVASNNSSDERSRRFFSKLVPSDLLSLCRMIKSMGGIPDSFHKYYFLYKFYEYVGFYSVDEIGVVCKVFSLHNIRPTFTNPIMTDLTRQILSKMIESHDPVMDCSIEHIDEYLGPHISRVSSAKEIEELQLNMLKCGNLSLGSLVRIAHFGKNHRFDSSTHELLSRIERKLLECGNDLQLNGSELIRLLLLVSCTCFHGNNEGPILRKLASRAKEILAKSDDEKSLTRIQIITQFLYLGIFDEEMLHLLKGDLRIFNTTKNGEVMLNDKLQYDVSDKTKLIRCSLSTIYGLMKIKGIESLLKPTKKTADDMLNYRELDPPSDSTRFFDDNTFFSLWHNVGRCVMKTVLSEAASPSPSDPNNFIMETTILPWFGLTDYVFCLDNQNELVQLPESFKNQPANEIKKIPEDFGHLQWKCITLVGPQRMARFLSFANDHRFGYLKMMQELGYDVNLFNLGCYDYSDDEEHQAKEDMKTMVRQILRREVA